MDKKKLVNLVPVAGGALLVKNQLDSGNLTGRELVFHNTNKKNEDGIKRKGILKTRSYDKDNITHKGLKGSVRVKDMGGLTYVGRNRMPALGVGYQAALHDSKDPSSKNHNNLIGALHDRTTLKAKVPSWRMHTTANPELMGTKDGKEYTKIVLDRQRKRTGKEPSVSDKIVARVSADIMHRNLGPKNTHTFKESIKPTYIKGSPKYKRADKDEVLDYIKNNPGRFAKGVGATALGTGAIALGLTKMAKEDYVTELEKQASVNIPMSLLGAGLIATSGDKILGKKRLYQGTSKENWEKIKSEGLKANMGGTGASKAVGNSAYQKNSEGKVHLTAMRPVANTYASVNTPEIKQLKHDIAEMKAKRFNIKVKQGEPGKSEVEYKLRRGYHKPNIEKIRNMENELRELNIKQRNNPINVFIDPRINTDGKTLRVNMDYNDWKHNMEQDREGVMFKKQINKLKGKNNPLIKNMAARGAIDVPIESISGSDATMKDRVKHTINELPDYIKGNPLRFTSGLASAGGGAYLLKKGLIR